MGDLWSAARPRALVDELADVVSTHTLDGVFLTLSAAVGPVLAHEPSSLVGRPLFDLVHPDDAPDLRRNLAGFLREGEPHRWVYRLRMGDGAYRWVESSASLVDASDLGPRVALITRDMTARQSLFRALQSERQLLRVMAEVRRQQRRFLVSVSHRLRTSITVVSGLAEVLAARDAALDETRRQTMIRRLREAATRLRRDLENASTLGDGVTDIDWSVVDLVAVVEEVVRAVAAPDVIPVEAPASAPLPGDRRLLARAVEALLVNALTHTPHNTPVRVRVEVESETSAVVVEDEGPGIPDEVRARAFEPFVQARDEVNPGFGIGLSLVATIAAHHGGRAWIEDRPGGGSVVGLRLSHDPQGLSTDVALPSFHPPDGDGAGPPAADEAR